MFFVRALFILAAFRPAAHTPIIALFAASIFDAIQRAICIFHIASDAENRSVKVKVCLRLRCLLVFFNCWPKKFFSESSVDCNRCLRAFHTTCGGVNMQKRIGENVCFYCLNNWAPRRGQFVHILRDERFAICRKVFAICAHAFCSFYPAQVARTEYPDALNTEGYVPVFLLGCGERNAESLQLVPHSFCVPAIAYEPMREYYERHPARTSFLSRTYKATAGCCLQMRRGANLQATYAKSTIFAQHCRHC